MSCNVPIWDLDDTCVAAQRSDLTPHHSVSNSSVLDSPLLDYEMAELIWENGQLHLHALGLPRVSSKPSLSSSTATAEGPWDVPRADVGTLESIVDFATNHQKQPPPSKACGGSSAATDALVPCEASTDEEGSVAKKARLETRVPAVEGEVRSASVSGSFGGGESWQVATVDTCTDKEESGGLRLPTTSFLPDKLLGNALSQPQPKEEEKKKGSSRPKLSLSTKRSRATTHSQSERKRRDTINQKLEMLHKMVPNSCKTDKASILDEVIEYLKKLQAQLQMMMMMTMNRMSMPMPSMMMPFHMPIMPPMPMDMNMNIINHMTLQNPAASLSPLLNPAMAFMPMAGWDVAADRLTSPPTVFPPDPTFLAGCQSQPMSTMEAAYSKMIALIQDQQRML